jgi:hypothetical protein
LGAPGRHSAAARRGGSRPLGGAARGRNHAPTGDAGAIFGLGVGVAALWAVTAVATAVGRTGDAGFTVSASLFYALAVATPIALLLAVGALTSQLVATRRQAARLNVVTSAGR